MLKFKLVLHPRLKLRYFRQKEWEEEWIDNAEDLVHKVYVTQYEGKEDVVGANLNTPVVIVSQQLVCVHSNTNWFHRSTVTTTMTSQPLPTSP